jgi:hypothetical protein
MEIIDAKIVIFRREDLKDNNKKFKKVSIMDFRDINEIYKCDISVFIDNDFRAKILKNRWF